MPTNLRECFDELDSIINSSDDKDWFFNSSEEEVLTQTHHGLGRKLRNEWKLWQPDSPMHMYFKGLGINHADDMSGIIIVSYHRHKHGQEIKLQEQINDYINFWKTQDVKK